MPRTLTDEDIEALALRIAELLRTQFAAATGEVLTRSEAKEYVKRNSEGAFVEWCKRWSVRPAFRGRYSRTLLDVALAREARARR